MKHRLMRVIAPLVCVGVIMSATLASGQVTTSLSGTVTDESGALLPGADVVAKSDGTGTTFTAVTGQRRDRGKSQSAAALSIHRGQNTIRLGLLLVVTISQAGRSLETTWLAEKAAEC